jgi:hypothetical protein
MSLKLELTFDEMLEILKKASLNEILSFVEKYYIDKYSEKNERVEFNREALNSIVYYTIEPAPRYYELNILVTMVFTTGLHVEILFRFNRTDNKLEYISVRSYVKAYTLD